MLQHRGTPTHLTVAGGTKTVSTASTALLLHHLQHGPAGSPCPAGCSLVTWNQWGWGYIGKGHLEYPLWSRTPVQVPGLEHVVRVQMDGGGAVVAAVPSTPRKVVDAGVVDFDSSGTLVLADGTLRRLFVSSDSSVSVTTVPVLTGVVAAAASGAGLALDAEGGTWWWGAELALHHLHGRSRAHRPACRDRGRLPRRQCLRRPRRRHSQVMGLLLHGSRT